MIINIFSVNLKNQENNFFNRYPIPYQDVLVKNKVIIEGSQKCRERYELIKPILDLYQRPFKVLDIGSAQGYFSLKIAEEYNAVCVMIEGGVYKNHPDQLSYICKLNDHLNNLIFLNHFLDLKSLQELNAREHFDVVLALLVIHQISDHKKDYKDYLENAKEIAKELLKLGDNVIIEIHDDFLFNFFSKEVKCQYLGEVFRYKNSSCPAKGHFFWFKKELNKNLSENIDKVKEDSSKNFYGIKLETFYLFNGIYPSPENCQYLRKNKKESQRF